MKLDLMMLANYAEVAPNGLLYIAGGGWDTITVNAPIEEPEGVYTAMAGALAIKLLFHATETERSHHFEVTIMDDDGVELAKSAGDFEVPRNNSPSAMAPEHEHCSAGHRDRAPTRRKLRRQPDGQRSVARRYLVPGASGLLRPGGAVELSPAGRESRRAASSLGGRGRARLRHRLAVPQGHTRYLDTSPGGDEFFRELRAGRRSERPGADAGRPSRYAVRHPA